MDADPYVEPELDAFSLVLPLPYRVAIIIVLGGGFLRVHATFRSFEPDADIGLQEYGPGASTCTT